MLKTVKRKTALFFSDIVGYSKMVSRSESHTLDLLKEHDIILEKEIASMIDLLSQTGWMAKVELTVKLQYFLKHEDKKNYHF